MVKKILDTPQSTYSRERATIFNFPLSKAGRNQLEELAAIWDVSLAAAIRRSIDDAHRYAKANDKTSPQMETKHNKVVMLETLLAMHAELSATRANTTKILAAMPMDVTATNTTE